MPETPSKPNYEGAIREKVIPHLQGLTDVRLWGREGKDAFTTGSAGSYGNSMPNGVYSITITREGKLNVEGLRGELRDKQFSIEDDRIKELYSTLEEAEKSQPAAAVPMRA